MRFKLLALVVSGSLLLQGCAVFVIGAGAAAAKSATDRRSVGTQIDDTTSSSAIAFRWRQDESLGDSTNLHANVYNGVALLTGQAPSQAVIDQAQAVALATDNIDKVHNQIRLGNPIDAAAQANDLWIDSKVKAELLVNKDVPATQIKVVVENGEVFLMGRLTNLEASRAIEITRNIKGVKRVVRALELINS